MNVRVMSEECRRENGGEKGACECLSHCTRLRCARLAELGCMAESCMQMAFTIGSELDYAKRSAGILSRSFS